MHISKVLPIFIVCFHYISQGLHFILLTDWKLLQDLCHGSVPQSTIHTLATKQARLLAHALSCEYRESNMHTHTHTHTHIDFLSQFVIGSMQYIKHFTKNEKYIQLMLICLYSAFLLYCISSSSYTFYKMPAR